MKTIDKFLEKYISSEIFDQTLLKFLDESQACNIGYVRVDKEPWPETTEAWTEENIRCHLKDDIKKGIELAKKFSDKAYEYLEKAIYWCSILEIKLEPKDIDDYGLKLFKEIRKELKNE